MMSGSQIRKMSDDATVKARKAARKPLVFWSVETVEKEIAHMPFLGDFVHKDFQVVEDENMFVDISGFGAPGEAALSYSECKAEIKRLIQEHGKELVGFAFTELGQFQGYIQVYRYIGNYDQHVDPMTDVTPFLKS